MAKIAKKKQTNTVNPRSRAAKRASSPGINVDKSIKDAPRALGTSPTLGTSRDSGITKRKKIKPMTRGQRARQEKVLARAEIVMDRMERKVDGARAKQKKIHGRRALWEDVNDATVDELRKTVKTPGRDVTAAENQDKENTETDGIGEIDMGNVPIENMPETSSTIPQDPSVPLVAQTSTETLRKDDSDLIT